MKKRQINNLANGYMKIQLAIDEKQKKLSDKLKNIELSHNRKYKLLEKIENYLEILKKDILSKEKPTTIAKASIFPNIEILPFEIALINEIIQKIEKELNSTGRMKGF